MLGLCVEHGVKNCRWRDGERCKKWPPPWFAYTEDICIQRALEVLLGQVEYWVGTPQIRVWGRITDIYIVL